MSKSHIRVSVEEREEKVLKWSIYISCPCPFSGIIQFYTHFTIYNTITIQLYSLKNDIYFDKVHLSYSLVKMFPVDTTHATFFFFFFHFVLMRLTDLGTRQSARCRVVASSSNREEMSLPWGTDTRVKAIFSAAWCFLLENTVPVSCRCGYTRTTRQTLTFTTLKTSNLHLV